MVILASCELEKKGSNSIRRMSAIEVNVSKSFWKEVVAKRPLEDKSCCCVVSQYRERPLYNWYYKSWEVILRMHTVEKQEIYNHLKNISWIQIFLHWKRFAISHNFCISLWKKINEFSILWCGMVLWFCSKIQRQFQSFLATSTPLFNFYFGR